MNQSTRVFSGLFVLVAVASACDGGTGEGAGGGGGSDGNGGGGANAQSAEPLASEAVEATAATIALAAPLFLGGDQLRKEQDSADEARGRALIEDAVATNSIVTSAACVTFDWSGLTVSVTFDACTLEATGLPLDGAITLTATIKPTAFSLAFEQLTMGTSSVDGTVAVSFVGEGMMGRTTTADLTVTEDGATTQFTLTDGRLDVEDGVITANGSGTIATSTVDASYEVDGVRWAQGEKCPSGGTLTLDEADLPRITVTFFPTTPSDGTVDVKVGNLPTTSEVLGFCAP
jgi:adhesin HecA-like repeat protein